MKKLNPDVRIFEIEGIPMIGNFQNGAIIGLDDYGKEYFQKGRADALGNEKIASEIEASLKSLGYLDDMSGRRTVKSAYVHLTDHCSLHCAGCYSYLNDRNKSKDLSKDAIFHIFKQLKTVGVSEVVISGGEPFMHKDIAEICKFAKEGCGISFLTAITNGCMGIEDYMPALPYIDELNISVDGYDEGTSFIRDKGIMPRVIKTIEMLKPHVPIGLIFTLHRKNMLFMANYAEFAARFQARYSFSIFSLILKARNSKICSFQMKICLQWQKT